MASRSPASPRLITAPPATWLSGVRFAAIRRATPFWKSVSGIPGTLVPRRPVATGRPVRNRGGRRGWQALRHERDEILADLEVARRVPEALRVEPPEELAGQLQPLESVPRRLDRRHSRRRQVHCVPSTVRGEAPIPIMDSNR